MPAAPAPIVGTTPTPVPAQAGAAPSPAIWSPAQPPGRQTQPERQPETGLCMSSMPARAHRTAGMPAAEPAGAGLLACNQHVHTSMQPRPVNSSAVAPGPSTIAEAAAAAPKGDGRELAADITEILHSGLPQAAPAGQASTMAIEWDDWEPDQQWSPTAVQPCPPVLEEPGAVGHSIPDTPETGDAPEAAEDASHAEGLGSAGTAVDCEPQLMPCKTATKGMLYDRYPPWHTRYLANSTGTYLRPGQMLPCIPGVSQLRTLQHHEACYRCLDMIVQAERALMCTAVRRFAAQTWVYPASIAERAYQVAMVEQALLHNTLVCLPTGLGKTFIAAVVMYNFFRWFPEVCSCQDLAFPTIQSEICVPPKMSKQQSMHHSLLEHACDTFQSPLGEACAKDLLTRQLRGLRRASIDRAIMMKGKVIFLAPTKPLVHQQMQACQQFMGSAKVCLRVATLL